MKTASIQAKCNGIQKKNLVIHEMLEINVSLYFYV